MLTTLVGRRWRYGSCCSSNGSRNSYAIVVVFNTEYGLFISRLVWLSCVVYALYKPLRMLLFVCG